MPCEDPLTYLKAVIARDFEAERYARKNQPREPLVVTVSRDFGAEGEKIARSLAQCLNIPVYDQEILDRVSERAKIDKFYFQSHDEQVDASISSFFFSLVTGATVTRQTYRRVLYDVVLELAEKDGILIGRGAHLILQGKKLFRLRIVGSADVCAKRIAREFDMPLADAEKEVHDINSKRHKSIQNLFGDSFERCSLDHAENFDLVVNSDFIPAAGAVPIILMAMRQAGFDIRRSVGNE